MKVVRCDQCGRTEAKPERHAWIRAVKPGYWHSESVLVAQRRVDFCSPKCLRAFAWELQP